MGAESTEPRKLAEVEYPLLVEREGGGQWLRSKPFRNTPQLTARLLMDFAYAVRLLDLQEGMRLCELGCGPGWMTIFAARHGVEAEGFDIAPRMIEIARTRAEEEAVNARFMVADMEDVRVDREFDACLIYEALHHTPRADLVFASCRRLLRPGGQLLLVEPNWKHRYQGRAESRRYGATELGYTPRRLKRHLKDAGFIDIERFHNNRKRLFGNSPQEIVAHLCEPVTYRVLAPFWTQIWLRATSP